MSANYIEISISAQNLDGDAVIALLSDFPFNGFEDKPGMVQAYIAATDYDEDLEADLSDLAQEFGWVLLRKDVAGQNWNAAWEQGYEPVEVDDFCRIRADFHESRPGFAHELLITPKMSFGTGHHATTRLVIREMRTLNLKSACVLDYGCGTGVLGILAAKLGADVEAVDIEPWAVENSLENAALNGLEQGQFRCYLGDLEAAPKASYDFILANINRHVLLEQMPQLAKRLAKGATMLCSGFLIPDRPVLLAAAQAAGLDLYTQTEDADWSLMSFVKH